MGASQVVRNLPFLQEKTFVSTVAKFFKGDGAKLLGIGVAAAAALVGAVLTYKEEQDAKKRERERSEVRQNIIADFEKIANDVARKMNESFNKWLNENAAPIVDKFNEEIKGIETKTANAKIQNEKLAQMLKRTENLIAEIQA